jgi:hypothetical protein
MIKNYFFEFFTQIKKMSRQEITNNIKKHMYKEMKMFLVDSHDMSNVKAENILKMQ